MKIGICGLGYVGLTSAACFLKKGYDVIGFDVSEAKIRALSEGCCPISEPGVEDLIENGVKDGSFTVCDNISLGNIPDVIFICVGTPSNDDGSADISAVRSVLSQIEKCVSGASPGKRYECILRSTIPIGTLNRLMGEYESLFSNAIVAFYPEFLREGSALSDFENPPISVVGVRGGGECPPLLDKIFSNLMVRPNVVDFITAESIKLACNAFHAIKVCFANEIGRLVLKAGGDASDVMRLFVKDTVLNVSHRYLMPGAPYGGSCLPKDVRSLLWIADASGLKMDLVDACDKSNKDHLKFIVSKIVEKAPKRIGVLGLAFKSKTDDVRESPSVDVIKHCARLGIEVLVHDYVVKLDRAIGVNKAVLDEMLKINSISVNTDIDSMIKSVDLIVLMQKDARYDEVLAANSQVNVINVASWIL